MAATKKWVILLPIIIGIAGLVLLKKSSTPPVQEAKQEQAQMVRVISAPLTPVRPTAEGFGTVRPSRTWEAVAQVRGKLVHKHERLQKGAILEQDSLILEIDPTDYELAIAQAKADIAATRAQLEELQAKAENTRASLKIEQQALELNQKELQRKRKLVGRGGVSHSDLESQERTLLAQQQNVQGQINTLNLLPSQQALLEAQLARLQAALTSAERNLANTRIRLPFPSRATAVNAEQGQYVREGEILASFDDLQQAEIEIQLPIDQMSSLIQAQQPVDILEIDLSDALQRIGIDARVSLQENSLQAEWPARFARLSDTLDPKTRTVGVIVEVDDPYGEVMPGSRPPLVKGLFVKVLLSGRPLPDQIVVPRAALQPDNRLYIVDAQQRLQIREVEVGLKQPEFVVIKSGLDTGEQVVVSDLLPAIEGMLLKPLEDMESRQRLLASITGGARQ